MSREKPDRPKELITLALLGATGGERTHIIYSNALRGKSTLTGPNREDA